MKERALHLSGQNTRVQPCGILGGSLERGEGVIPECNLGLTGSAEDTHLEPDAVSEVAAAARWLGVAQRLAGSRPRGKVSLREVEGVRSDAALGRRAVPTAHDGWVRARRHGQAPIRRAHSTQVIDASMFTASAVL